MVLPLTKSISTPINHQRGIYLYHMKYYAILKEHLQVLHKLQPKDFKI